MMSEEPKIRGRKRTSNLYFGPEQEEAVVKFLTSESYSERNKIYNLVSQLDPSRIKAYNKLK